MKNITIVLLLVIALALGALAVRQNTRSVRTQAELAGVQSQLAEAQQQLAAAADAADQIARAKRSSKMLQDTLTETSRFADEKTKQAELLQQELAAKTNSSNPMAGMAKMFKDPKMREMIKTQQKAVMGPMIDKQYASLFQQLQMSPEESAQLKTLLVDKMLAGADKGMSMLDDSLTADQRADMAKEVKSQQDDYDAQIKQYLGDSYSAYQSYEKTVSDRTVVNGFGDQLTGDLAMSSDQQAQMVKALTDARTGFKWTTDYTKNQTPADGNVSAMFSEDKLNTFTREKEQFDSQFLAQAQKILTPEQAKQFQQYQESQRQLQIMGMKMAAQMFPQK